MNEAMWPGRRCLPHALFIVGSAIVGLYAILLRLPPMHFVVRDVDHGNQLSKALMILHDRHPFADIMNSVYGPLVFYASAAAQWLSGGSMRGEMLLITVMLLCTVVVFADVVRRCVGATIPSAIIVLVLLTLLPKPFKYYVFLGPMLLAWVLLMSAARPWRMKTIALLAGTTVITGLFRLDFGVYATVAAVTALTLPRRDESTPLMRRTITFLGMCFVMVLPWLVFLMMRSNLIDVMHDTIRMTFASTQGMATNQAAVGKFDAWHYHLLHHMTWLIPVASIVLLIAMRSVRTRRDLLFVIPMAVLAGGIFLQATHRVSVSHLVQVQIIPLVLTAWIVGACLRCRAKSTPQRWMITAATALLILAWWPELQQTVKRGQTKAWNSIGEKLSSYDVTASEWRSTKINPRRNEALVRQQVCSIVTTRTAENDAVLFLPYAPQLYWFSDRQFVTPFGWLNPGRFRDQRDEDAFIAALDDTRLIIDELTHRFPDVAVPAARDYASDVMRTISAHRPVVDAAGPFLIHGLPGDVIADDWTQAARIDETFDHVNEPTDEWLITCNGWDAPGTLMLPIGGGLLVRCEAMGGQTSTGDIALLFVQGEIVKRIDCAPIAHEGVVEARLDPEFMSGQWRMLLRIAEKEDVRHVETGHVVHWGEHALRP